MSAETYQSPFSWRYASPEMRSIWSDENKRKLWRTLWIALAEVQSEFGLVKTEQVDDLKKHKDEINIERAHEIEAEIHHDLMAEVKTYAEQCKTGGGIIHLGATSMDIEDNADVLRIRQAMELLLENLKTLLRSFEEKIRETAKQPIMAFTHIQPAEPSTLGYRLAIYAQDLLDDWHQLTACYADLKGKGFKGAVGTAASYCDLLGKEQYIQFEQKLSEKLELPFFAAATQTYPRKQDYRVMTALAGLGASLYKFAFDLRLLQSPPMGELGEPFGKKQVGSSAMPFKRNPIKAENINSMARSLSTFPQIAWDNAAHSLLERTLDDSGNRRSMLPEAFLNAEHLIRTASKIISGLQIRTDMIQKNLDKYAPFAATERLMMSMSSKGADRQVMHELLRDHAIKAWEEVQKGNANPLTENLKNEPEIGKWLDNYEITDLMNVQSYTGIASDRALFTAERISILFE